MKIRGSIRCQKMSKGVSAMVEDWWLLVRGKCGWLKGSVVRESGRLS